MVEFELRDQPLARAVADKRPAKQAMPGDTIVLQRYEDLSLATSALDEVTPNTPVSVGTPIKKTITLQEFGNSALVTRKLQLTSLADVDSDIAILLANNQADSIDSVAMAQLVGGDNAIYGGDATGTGSVATGDTITSTMIRKAVAKLRGNKAVGRRGSLYWGGIHPDVSADLREESDLAGWRAPHSYSDPSNVWAGEIGTYEGVYWVESPRLTTGIDGADGTPNTSRTATGSSGAFTITASGSVAAFAKIGDKVSGTGIGSGAKITAINSAGTGITVDVANSGSVSGTLTVTPVAKVYRSLIAGRQALAEAVAEEPHTIIGTVTDPLKRYRPIGWYGVLGFARYREEALYRLETTSDFA
jgi:N4-gp56 family major capsid protein